MSADPVRPARRFLHICYCCDDSAPVVADLSRALGMRNTMSTPMERSPGEVLGLEGQIESKADFLYDARGPRHSPAIEVQGWADPPLVGTPLADPTAVGIQALGAAVRDAAATVAGLEAQGWERVGEGRPEVADGWFTSADPRGVRFDFRDSADVPDGEAHLAHLRITCAELDRSLPWYEGLGFEVTDRSTMEGRDLLGLDGEVRADFARLGLPDHPFEVLLVQWMRPASHGRHPAEPNHAGLWRAALGVDDTRAAYEQMQTQGWDFDRAPMSIELKDTPVPDMWICFLSDPDGVPFEFVERPREAFG